MPPPSLRTILSVDLAARRYQDIGIAVIEYLGGTVRARFVKPRHALLKAPASVDVLASFLTGIAQEARSVAILIIDGPQGWKHPEKRTGARPHVRAADLCREPHGPPKSSLAAAKKCTADRLARRAFARDCI